MNWLVENWSLLVAVTAVVVCLGFAIVAFAKLGKEKQIEKIKEWLLYACTMAEKELGGGTGQLKLRYVYDMFVQKFSFVQVMISFEEFSSLVDGSLEKMKEMLANNSKVEAIVKSK